MALVTRTNKYGLIIEQSPSKRQVPNQLIITREGQGLFTDQKTTRLYGIKKRIDKGDFTRIWIGGGVDGDIFRVAFEDCKEKNLALKIFKKPDPAKNGLSQLKALVDLTDFIKVQKTKHFLLEPIKLYAASKNFLLMEYCDFPTHREVMLGLAWKNSPDNSSILKFNQKDIFERELGQRVLGRLEKAAKFLEETKIKPLKLKKVHEELVQKSLEYASIRRKGRHLFVVDKYKNNFFIRGMEENRVVLSLIDQSLMSKKEWIDFIKAFVKKKGYPHG